MMMTSCLNQGIVACRLVIGGVVQGVGFRRSVRQLAELHGIAGCVRNHAESIEIHAEGDPDSGSRFLSELKTSPPPTGSIDRFQVCDETAVGLSNFEIRATERDQDRTTPYLVDIALCDDCRRDVADPQNRRHRYAFTSCAKCGPRYSVMRSLPYERSATAMADWKLCNTCRNEQKSSDDPRHQDQLIACDDCGPQYSLRDARQQTVTDEGDAAIISAANRLKQGEIVAIKSIGGYQLACDARNIQAVMNLRNRKRRKEKPFALMARTIEEARQLADLSEAHEHELQNSAHPIVLAPFKKGFAEVPAGSAVLGLMLPYTPVHHLLFASGAPSPLVVTSANRCNEPTIYREEEAQAKLPQLADSILQGERPIVRRVDDSVVTIRDGEPLLVRRSRGYAPDRVCSLPTDQTILAVGSDLKNSIALVHKGEVFVSPHFGNLGTEEADRGFATAVNGLLAMHDLRSHDVIVAHDRQSELFTSRFAKSLPAKMHIAIQHHSAHIASVLAEHQVFDERVVGVALDGAGTGDDRSIWGGEILIGGLRTGFQRRAGLRPVWMPDGDETTRFPEKAAAAFLAELHNLPNMSGSPFEFKGPYEHAQSLISTKQDCSRCSYTGRLFETVAALLGFTREVSFDGQPAIWLEQLARRVPRQVAYPFHRLDHRPLVHSIIQDRLAGRAIEEIASAFHAAMAEAIASQVEQLCLVHELSTIALSGGVLQNDLLWEQLRLELSRDTRVRILTNQHVPVNDGGLSLGQAALAAFQLKRTSRRLTRNDQTPLFDRRRNPK